MSIRSLKPLKHINTALNFQTGSDFNSHYSPAAHRLLKNDYQAAPAVLLKSEVSLLVRFSTSNTSAELLCTFLFFLPQVC